jgi:hypothetical protein
MALQAAAVTALLVPQIVLCYDIGAFYFGNWHIDPLNEAYHGTNWTEWELVQHALPRFPNHQQPKHPLWGFQMEDMAAVMEQKINAAADHGVDFFIFDWYWHQDTGPFLYRPLEHGFLNATNNHRLKFAVMWANHNWVDIHPMKRRWPSLLQFPGEVDRLTFDKIVNHTIEVYFKHPSYYRAQGCPFYSIYHLNMFINGLGSVQAAEDALNSFRDKAKVAGFPCIHINAVDASLPQSNEVLTQLNLNSITSYNWASSLPQGQFPTVSYSYMLNVSINKWNHCHKTYPIPYIPNVSISWDSSPRACQSDIYQHVGYPFLPVFDSNQTEFQTAHQRLE